MRITQPIMIWDRNGAIGIIALDQKRDRRLVAFGAGDGVLEAVGVVIIAIHRDDLGAQRDARLERWAAPGHVHDIPLVVQYYAQRISEAVALAHAIAGRIPVRRLVGIDQPIAATSDAV